jgi:hypothetical protein
VRLFLRGLFVLPGVDAHEPLTIAAAVVEESCEVVGDVVHAAAVEAVSIDDGFVVLETEHSRVWVPRLRFGSDTADLNEGEAEIESASDGISILIKPRR